MSILVVGSLPNLFLYASLLAAQEPPHVVTPTLLRSVAILSQKAPQKRVFNPVCHPTFPTQGSYATVLLSADLLQALLTVCADLAPLLAPRAVVVVESTGFLQLEGYVLQNLAAALGHSDFTVLLAMTDADVKRVGNGVFACMSRTAHDYLYLGSASGESYSEAQQSAILDLTRRFESSNASVLRVAAPKEFLNYQWKFALPRAVFSPLLVIFELPYPALIANQILAKPLILGLLHELLALLKKMGCKLIKGYENETALLRTWSKAYPEVTEKTLPLYPILESALAESGGKTSGLLYLATPDLFFRFVHQQTLAYDPLLLQPILLADDHLVKTPYLEFLYTTLLQYARLNAGELMFFSRGNDKKSADLAADLAAKNKALDESNQHLARQISELLTQLGAARAHSAKLAHQIRGLRRQLLGGSQLTSQLQTLVQTPRKLPSKASFRGSAEDLEALELSFSKDQPPRGKRGSIGNISHVASQAVPQALPQYHAGSQIPSLQNQALFIDKPYGAGASSLPIKDVSLRFTPQLRKNRKSGMPRAPQRVPSTAGRDIDEYSLYGGSLPSGGQRAPRNRQSSFKNLAQLNRVQSQTNQQGMPNGIANGSAAANGSTHNANAANGLQHAARASLSFQGHPAPTFHTGLPSSLANGSPVTNSSASGALRNGTGQQSSMLAATATGPTPRFSQGISSNLNDLKNLFNSLDGIFLSGNNSSSIDTQNTQVDAKESSTTTVVPEKLEKVERSNSLASKKSKMKLFFGKKNKT